MPDVTVKSICQDTKYFLQNYLVSILVIVLLCSLITTLSYCAFYSSQDQSLLHSSDLFDHKDSRLSESLKHSVSSQKKTLLAISTASILSSLINDSFLFSSVLLFLTHISSGHKISALYAFFSSIRIVPTFFSLVLTTNFLNQIGMLIFIVPGILSSVMLSLSPVVLIRGIGLIQSMKISVCLSWKNIRVVAPAVFFNLTMKSAILVCIAYTQSRIPYICTILLANALSNLISAVLLVYLFRFYMFITPYVKPSY